jgi:uncharacterized protein (TIGR04255 family)
LLRFGRDVFLSRLMPHYNRAPITEALIDIRTETSQLRFEDLRALKRHLSDYPTEETRTLGEFKFQFGQEVQAASHQKPWALLFRNQENNQVVQFRLDGITFSRLEPYEDWEHLSSEARRLWDIYRKAVGVQKIVRIAVRYINLFKLPGDSVEPEEYLNIFPQVPQKLPRELRNFGPFSMSLPMHQPDLKGILVINERNAPQAEPGIVPIVMDLDLYVDNPPVGNEEELWAFFERLRERKNLYFEASITDKTRELIS